MSSKPPPPVPKDGIRAKRNRTPYPTVSSMKKYTLLEEGYFVTVEIFAILQHPTYRDTEILNASAKIRIFNESALQEYFSSPRSAHSRCPDLISFNVNLDEDLTPPALTNLSRTYDQMDRTLLLDYIWRLQRRLLDFIQDIDKLTEALEIYN